MKEGALKMVCDKVVCERWCVKNGVSKMVGDKCVCVKDGVSKMVCVTGWGVKDGVSKMVCEKVV